MFELRHLRALVAIRDTGSLASAAKLQHITLSALSHGLKDLEEALGVSLVVRKSKPISFTAAGMRLLALAEQILPEVDLAEQDVRRIALGTRGRLLLAMECHSCFDWLLPTLNAYREAWADVDLDVRIGLPFDAYPGLKSGLVDLVVSSDPIEDPDITFFPLFRYEIMVACGVRHPLAEKEWVEPADFEGETIITYPVKRDRLDFFRRFLHPAGIFPERVRHAELTQMILQLVASGQGVAALPSWAMTREVDAGIVRSVRIGEAGLSCDLYAAVRASDAKEAYMDAFLREARRTSFLTLRGITELGH